MCIRDRSTGTLNKVVRDAVEAHPPAQKENRQPRIYYATQVDSAPPTIVLFVNSAHLFNPTYQRYLLNTFREKLPFHDIPIKLYMRSRKQTDPSMRRKAGRDSILPGDEEFINIDEETMSQPMPGDAGESEDSGFEMED